MRIMMTCFRNMSAFIRDLWTVHPSLAIPASISKALQDDQCQAGVASGTIVPMSWEAVFVGLASGGKCWLRTADDCADRCFEEVHAGRNGVVPKNEQTWPCVTGALLSLIAHRLFPRSLQWYCYHCCPDKAVVCLDGKLHRESFEASAPAICAGARHDFKQDLGSGIAFWVAETNIICLTRWGGVWI